MCAPVSPAPHHTERTPGGSRRARRATPERKPALELTPAPTEQPAPLTDGALALLDQPALTPRATPARHTILIVEDDLRAAGVIREYLSLEGEPDWGVEIAREGRRALAMASATPPDVVLLDVRLPGLDGAEVYRQLKSAYPTSRARVIFLSGGSPYELALRGIEDGVLLRKPFDVHELVQLVRALLAQ